ncbi:MAG TPA: hypothetical protein VG847_03490 [Chitinophagaceae bacterium]|nr:hypothetical protein [Chitinophagaceae bacterium]
MSKQDTKDLLRFLAPFEKETKEIVLWLRNFIWDRYPKTNELIYDNYNAVAFGWSPTDKLGHVFCSIAVYRTNGNVHFGFYWGSQLKDPEKKLLGSGNQYRYILVKNKKDFPKAYIEKLVQEAFVNSLAKIKDPKQVMEGKTIIKSVSPNKRKRPGKPKAAAGKANGKA